MTDCLPKQSLLTVREDVAGIDSINFYKWSIRFCQYCKPLTINGRKVLLTLDAYRSYMNLRSLQLLKENGVIVSALPAHMSEVTQPLDVGVFGPFKESLRNLVESLSSPLVQNCYDAFDYLKLIREAFHESFTFSNISSASKKSGINPLSWETLIKAPLPLSSIPLQTIATVDDIIHMIEEKRSKQRNKIGLQPVVIKHDYLDTSTGLRLTSKEALEKARKKEVQDGVKRAEEARRVSKSAKKQALCYESARNTRLRDLRNALRYRVSQYGDPNILPRSFAVRRPITKQQIAMQRAMFLNYIGANL